MVINGQIYGYKRTDLWYRRTFFYIVFVFCSFFDIITDKFLMFRWFMAKNLIVVKSNDFVEASYKITLDEMRVLLLTIGSINSKLEAHNREFEFSVAEFAERFGVNEKVAYQQVQKAIDLLGGRWALIEKTDKVERKVTFLTEQAYFKGEGRFQIILHEKLMPFLSDIQGKFTEYNLEYVARFNSFHAIRIYEIVTQYRHSKEKERIVLVSDLKEWLQISDKYSAFFDFKKRVLTPAINEINEKSDLFVEFEQIKRGRSIHALKFLISPKKQATQAVENTENLTKSGRPKLPQRPQVKKGTDAEAKWARECIKVLEDWRSTLKERGEKLSTSDLELLCSYYKMTGDWYTVEKITEVIEKRQNKENKSE